MNYDTLTWTCHICRRRRDDRDIGVFTRDISARYKLKKGTMMMNTRYCLDSIECRKGAQEREDFK